MQTRQINIGSRQIDVSYNKYSNIDRQINEIINNKEYEKAIRKRIVVDIGACIGLFSFFIYDYADEIYAVEPIETNYNCLVETIKNNNLDKIKPVKIGIAHINGDVYFSTPTNGMGFMINPKHKMKQLIKVITLNQFLIDQDIDYVDVMKIDAEGSESLIFDAPDIESACLKIPFIIIENHTGSKIYDKLETLGYNIRNREGQKLTYIEKSGIKMIHPPFQGRYLVLTR